MNLYLAGFLIRVDLMVVVIIGITVLAAIIYCIQAGVPCPGWLNHLIKANANIYHAIPTPMIPVLFILYIVGFLVSVVVLSIAVAGGTYIMDDPNYPALLKDAPWFEWVMFTSIELFSLGIRVVSLTVPASILLAVYHFFSSKRGLKKCEQ